MGFASLKEQMKKGSGWHLMKTRVLVDSALSDSGRQYLLDRYYELVVAPEDMDGQTNMAQSCDAMLLHQGTWSRERLQQAGTRLKVICVPGFDNDPVDLSAASALGIWVVDSDAAGVESRAEYEIALLLSCCKQIVRMDYLVHSQNAVAYSPAGNTELRGKKIGFIGWDETAALVAHKCRLAFEMESCCLPQNQLQMLPATVGRCSSMERLLAESDFVCIHAALRPGMLDHACFCRMKPTAYLICIANEWALNCSDLCDALWQEMLAGAAVGQGVRQQPSGEQLWQQPGVVPILPLSYYTYEALNRMDLFAAQAVDTILCGHPIPELRTHPQTPRIRLYREDYQGKSLRPR